MPILAVNTYNESALHASLKSWYAGTDASFEVPFDGFIVDIVEDGILVEIQTQNFSGIRPKLETLLCAHPVRLVYPIPTETWIIREEGSAEMSRRKSPKRGLLEHVFGELVYIPRLINHPNFTLDVLFTQMEEVRAANRRRRKGWNRVERRLLSVLDHRLFFTPADMTQLLPDELADPFTTHDLATVRSVPLKVAQQMLYCYRHMETIRVVGKQRRSILYERAD